jgi:hypothetical protein
MTTSRCCFIDNGRASKEKLVPFASWAAAESLERVPASDEQRILAALAELRKTRFREISANCQVCLVFAAVWGTGASCLKSCSKAGELLWQRLSGEPRPITERKAWRQSREISQKPSSLRGGRSRLPGNHRPLTSIDRSARISVVLTEQFWTGIGLKENS